MNTFSLTINLGNDAMQSPEDVAQALRQAADQVLEARFDLHERKIRDANGNTVGSWEVK